MKIQNRQEFLVVLTIIVVALYAGDLLVFEPMAKWWSSRSQAISALRKQVSEGKLLLQREESVRSRWQEMSTNTLPSNGSVAEQQVLKAFDSWSRDSGAEVTDIMPQWKNDADEYSTLSCRVEANGNLSTLAHFMYDIEKDPMGLKLESVELSTRDNTGQKLSLGLQVSGLVLVPNTTQ